MKISIKLLSCLLVLFAIEVHSKCSYSQPPSGLPYYYDGDAFPINYT